MTAAERTAAPTRRIFVAVPLEPALREAVAALERRLEDAGCTLRWVRPENLHFTLRFLGHISEAEVERARRAAREAGAATRPFRVRLAGVGAFPRLSRPQVVWIGVREGAEALAALAARVEDALASQGFPREPRAFTPHLTLARVREPARGGRLGAILEAFRDEEVGEQGVSSILVMESLLRPQGALYTPVEEVRLHPHEK